MPIGMMRAPTPTASAGQGPTLGNLSWKHAAGVFSQSILRKKNSQMPRHLISDAHEWINEIPTVPIYYPAKPQLRERAKHNQRGKKTLLSLTVNNGAQTKSMMPTPERLDVVIFGFSVAKLVEKDIKTSKKVIKFIFFDYIREKKTAPEGAGRRF